MSTKFFQRWGRSLSVTVAAALALCPATQASDWRFDSSYNYWSGDYGTSTETDTTYIPFTWTRYFSPGSLSLTVPYISVSGTSGVTIVGGRPDRQQIRSATLTSTESGLGDIVASGKLNVMSGSPSGPDADVYAFVKFPTADEDDGLGSGEFDEGIGLDLTLPFDQKNFAVAQMGYTLIGDPPNVDYHDKWNLAFGAGRRVTRKLTVTGVYEEERAIFPGGKNPRDLFFTLDAAVRSDLVFYAGLLIGLSDGAPDTGIMLGGGKKFR